MRLDAGVSAAHDVAGLLLQLLNLNTTQLHMRVHDAPVLAVPHKLRQSSIGKGPISLIRHLMTVTSNTLLVTA